jgi:hypothetical protein
MIFCRSRNFIFVRTAKVASTSIEFALSLHCGGDDIVTPIGAAEELQRWQLGVAPRNFAAPDVEERYRAIIRSGDLEALQKAFATVQRFSLYWNHMCSREIRDRIGREAWHRAFKFSVVRNPYDFAVSMLYYAMSLRGVSRPRIDALTAAVTILRAGRNLDILRIGEEIAVDRILHYENLTEELRSIAAIIGADVSDALPRLKTDLRPPFATAESVLTPPLRWLVRRRWKEEFALFGYTP